MNILILNGNSDLGNEKFDMYVRNYQIKLHHLGNYVKMYHLRNLNLIGGKSDAGGFNQAKFTSEDDFRYVISSLKETDLLVFASPLIHGHISDLTTDFQERISAYYQSHPEEDISERSNSGYIYRIPLFGAIVMKGPDSSPQEILLNKLTQERIAMNLNTILSFYTTTDVSLTEAVALTLRSLDYRKSIENASNEMLAGY